MPNPPYRPIPRTISLRSATTPAIVDDQDYGICYFCRKKDGIGQEYCPGLYDLMSSGVIDRAGRGGDVFAGGTSLPRWDMMEKRLIADQVRNLQQL